MTKSEQSGDKNAVYAALDALDQSNQTLVAADLAAGLRVGGQSGAAALNQLAELARRYGQENDGAAGAILTKVQALAAQMNVQFDLAELLSRVRSG